MSQAKFLLEYRLWDSVEPAVSLPFLGRLREALGVTEERTEFLLSTGIWKTLIDEKYREAAQFLLGTSEHVASYTCHAAFTPSESRAARVDVSPGVDLDVGPGIDVTFSGGRCIVRLTDTAERILRAQGFFESREPVNTSVLLETAEINAPDRTPDGGA